MNRITWLLNTITDSVSVLLNDFSFKGIKWSADNWKGLAELSKAIGIVLPNKGGKYFLKVRTEESEISVFSRVDINKKTFFFRRIFLLKRVL